jgi:hypothetical protein
MKLGNKETLQEINTGRRKKSNNRRKKPKKE